MPRTLPCSFFKSWSPDMAYVLGYWFADGNMYSQRSCKSYVVSIGSKDVGHLEALRGIIGVGKLTRITGSDVFKLVICRKEMFDDLLRLGGTERKSLTLAWPEVPVEYLAHFVRGYVDGDGSLTWNRPGNSVLPMVTAAGTRAFLTGMAAEIRDATGIPAPICHHNRDSNVWSIAWYGIFAKCLAVWLYHHHLGLHLARKQLIAAQFRGWTPQRFYPSRVTEKMWSMFEEYLP